MVLFAWAIMSGLVRGMQNQAYDLIVKNRFNVAPPHPDVVLIDIDEASLAAMAGEFGRWPWPRSVMAELIESLARSDPRAIVFDITFVDPDLDHPEADAFLAEVAASHGNTFFSMIRLNPANDTLSELQLATLAGVRRHDPDAAETATVAMIVPYFYPQLSGARLGTNNLYADSDGIARRYHLYRDVAGWRVGSLPANLVSALGKPIPEGTDVLLNWRGFPGAYPTHSFYPLFTDEPAGEGFKDKIVIIGSTAPSLFDLKPTPMSQSHPGLEILATAIDNLYTGDTLRQLPAWFYAVVTAAALALLAWAFVYNVDYRVLNPLFTLIQSGFLAVSYLFLNYSSLFVDLSAPFAAGFMYFFIARTYSWGLNLRRNGHRLFSTVLDPGKDCQVLLVGCALPEQPRNARHTRAELMRRTGLTTYGVSAPRVFRASPLLAAVYKQVLLLYWLVPADETRAALVDLQRMLDGASASSDVHPDTRFSIDAFSFTVDALGNWREQGKAALARVLAAHDETLPNPPARITPTPSFETLCRENPEISWGKLLQRPPEDRTT